MNYKTVWTLIVIIHLNCALIDANAQRYSINGEFTKMRFEVSSTNPLLEIYYCNNQPCQGVLEERDSLNNLIRRQDLTNGKGNGFFELFFSNGLTKETGRQKDNNFIGTRTQFYESGNLKSVEYYPDSCLGNIDGIEKIGFFENGSIEYKWFYSCNWRPYFVYEFSGTEILLLKLNRQKPNHPCSSLPKKKVSVITPRDLELMIKELGNTWSKNLSPQIIRDLIRICP